MANLVMNSLSTQERILIIQTYYEKDRSIKVTFRKLREYFGQHKRPTESGIRKIVQRFEKSGSVEGRTAYQHARPVRTPENVASVSASVRERPSTSTRHRSQELNISRTTLSHFTC